MKITVVPVFFIGRRVSSIQSEDQHVHSGIDQTVDVPGGFEKVAVGAGNDLQAPLFGVMEHFVDIVVEKRLTPAPKMEEEHILGNFVDEPLVIGKLHLAPGLRIGDDVAQGAAKIALIDRLDLEMGGESSNTGPFEPISDFSKKPITHSAPGYLSVPVIDLVEAKIDST